MNGLQFRRRSNRRELLPRHDESLLEARQKARLWPGELTNAFDQARRCTQLTQSRCNRGPVRPERILSHNPRVVRQARSARFVQAEIERLQQRGGLLWPAASQPIVTFQHALHEGLNAGNISTGNASGGDRNADATASSSEMRSVGSGVAAAAASACSIVSRKPGAGSNSSGVATVTLATRLTSKLDWPAATRSSEITSSSIPTSCDTSAAR